MFHLYGCRSATPRCGMTWLAILAALWLLAAVVGWAIIAVGTAGEGK